MDDSRARASSGERPATGACLALDRFSRSCGAMLVIGCRHKENGLFLRHDERRREEDNRQRPAVGRQTQRDLDPSPDGKAADHEQPELVAVGQVELRRPDTPPASTRYRLRRHYCFI